MKDDKLTGKEEHACERQYHTYFTGPSDILFLCKAIQCIKTKALLLHDASDLTFFLTERVWVCLHPAQPSRHKSLLVNNLNTLHIYSRGISKKKNPFSY